MALQIDPSALLSSCGNNMTCTPTFIFWGVCVLAVIGLYQGVVLARRDKEMKPSDWRRATNAPGAAPEGFKWVLVETAAIK